jgi:hypothetical protein
MVLLPLALVSALADSGEMKAQIGDENVGDLGSKGGHERFMLLML